MEYIQFYGATLGLASPFDFDNLCTLAFSPPRWFLTTLNPGKRRIHHLFVLLDLLLSVLLKRAILEICLKSHKGHWCLSQVCGNTRLVFVCLFICPLPDIVEKITHWLCQGDKTGSKQRAACAICCWDILIFMQGCSTGEQSGRN